MQLKSKRSELTKRGFVLDSQIFPYTSFSRNELLSFLISPNPCERTISAKIIAKNHDGTFIEDLIKALSVEKKLYPKIAITEALGCLGKSAIEKCIPWLGKIGKNQYKTVPNKPFLKNNYPLPRDIIARTICKAEIEALSILIKNIDTNNIEQLSEGIDAIGYVSFYAKDFSAKAYILSLLFKYEKNLLITWKLIRALQAFPTQDVKKRLEEITKQASHQQLLWEAERSLLQIQKACA